MDNNGFEMPNLKKEEEEKNSEKKENNVQQEKIEIPQEYYDKLDKEKEERLQALEKKEAEKAITNENGGAIPLILINVIVMFGLLYGMQKISQILILGIPAYVILVSFISGSGKKENSKFGVSLLVSGMLIALVSFLLAMNSKNNSNTYIYYAYAAGIIAVLGCALSTAIIRVFFDKNVKAMGKIFYFLIIAVVLGGPYYIYTNYKDEFRSFVFNDSEIENAASEEEYIEKTLKLRYDTKYTCDKSSKKNYMDEVTHRRSSTIQCSAENGGEPVEVLSLYYNEDKNQFIVRDSYLDDLYINPLRKEIENEILNSVSAKKIDIGLYPADKCYFIGDCEMNEKYQKEMDLNNLHKYSDELRLKDYIGITGAEFFNKYQFEYNIVVRGAYSSQEDFAGMVNKIISVLENKGLQNTRGFTIIIKDTTEVKDVFKVSGKADGSKSFKNYQVINS